MPGGSNPLSELKAAIDAYLALGAGPFPDYPTMVKMYVEKVLLDIDALLEQFPDINREELEAEKDRIIEYYLNEARAVFEGKYNELKASVTNAKNVIKAIPSAIASAIASVAVPGSIGPVAPNPFKHAIDFKTKAGIIKATIDQFLRTISKILGLAEELGLNDLAPVVALVALAKPLVAAGNKMDKKAAEGPSDEEIVAETKLYENAAVATERLEQDEFGGIKIMKLNAHLVDEFGTTYKLPLTFVQRAMLVTKARATQNMGNVAQQLEQLNKYNALMEYNDAAAEYISRAGKTYLLDE